MAGRQKATREALVRLRPRFILTLGGALFAMCIFCVVVIGADSRYAKGGLSGGAFLAISWLGVVLFGGVTVDLIARDCCLVARLGDRIVVYLPFGMHRLLSGYQFSLADHPDLRVQLTEDSATSRVSVNVRSGDRALRSFEVRATQLDQATRDRCILSPAARPDE